MLPGASRAICGVICGKHFQGWICTLLRTDPAQDLVTAETGSTTVDHLDSLDRDLSFQCARIESNCPSFQFLSSQFLVCCRILYAYQSSNVGVVEIWKDV